MTHSTFKPLALAIATLALGSVGPCVLHAQDRADEQREHRDEHRDDQRDERDHRDQGEERNVGERHDDDQAGRWRHDHPHAAARCNDGFFTTTRDHDRACRKHGGVNVWLIG
jgi:Ni/Co efflux regulator RcnB